MSEFISIFKKRRDKALDRFGLMPVSPESRRAAKKMEEARLEQRRLSEGGRASTILTGGQGVVDTDPETLARRRLQGF